MEKWKIGLAAVIILGVLLVLLSLAAVLSSTDLMAEIQGNRIAVVEIKGPLLSEGDDSMWSSQVGARDMIELIKRADEDPSVSAILLEINSPGGGVVASKELEKAVSKANKPVVAYIDEAGASGAYYVASAADVIVADEDSITGSIGVIATVTNYRRLLDMLGINVTVITEGKNKAIGNPYRDMTPEEREILETLMEDAYNQFKSDVLDNRPFIDEGTFDEIADGRIMNGRQALEYGLIDMTGSREKAIEEAARLGEIEGKANLKYFRKERYGLSGLFAEVGYGLGKGLTKALEESDIRSVRLRS
jgi:protease-4